jgi:transcriptional antiterminator RfaH
MGAPYWAVVRSEPGREATAASFLTKSNFEIYLPRIREWRVNHGRRVATTPALFSNYLFCRIELQWHAVRWTVGVSGLVMNGGAPAKVPDSIIDELRGRERKGYVELPERPRLRPGDPIKVTTGLLMGASGLVSGMRGPDRVAVLLGFLGTAVLPVASVEAV